MYIIIDLHATHTHAEKKRMHCRVVAIVAVIMVASMAVVVVVTVVVAITCDGGIGGGACHSLVIATVVVAINVTMVVSRW